MILPGKISRQNNNELVAILGNFVNRTMVLTHKYFNGIVPKKCTLNESDMEALDGMAQFPGRIAAALENFRFREALGEFMNLARLGNKYLTDNEPWKKFPGDVERTGTILNISLQICAQLSIVGEPFLPFSSEKIRKMLNIASFSWAEATNLEWVMAGDKLNPADYVFDKINKHLSRPRFSVCWRPKRTMKPPLQRLQDRTTGKAR